MNTFHFDRQPACRNLHADYWQNRSMSQEAVEEWFHYTRRNWGIEPTGDGLGYWCVLDENKYTAFLLRWS